MRGLTLEPAPAPIAELDPIEDADLRPDGEGPEGVSLRRHPQMELLEHPRLWPIWDRWAAGVGRKLSRRAYERVSAFELACLQILAGAEARAREREMRSRMRRAGGESGE